MPTVSLPRGIFTYNAKASDRIDECVANSVEDTMKWAIGIAMLEAVVENMHGEPDVVICGAGTYEDIRTIIANMRPLSVAEVTSRATEVAVDRENER